MKRSLPWLVAGGIAIAGITAGYFIIDSGKRLPVFQPEDVNPELVPEAMQRQRSGHRIGEFRLTDQNGLAFSNDDLAGKIILADFFFVSCPSICPLMTTEMKTVYNEFKNEPSLLLLSHTVMPESDTPEVLKRYADSIDVSADRWKFLTGSKEEIYRLARRSYMVTRSEGQGDEHDFIHTENLVLVDSKGRIRGYYDGTSPADTKRAVSDIRILLREEKSR